MEREVSALVQQQRRIFRRVPPEDQHVHPIAVQVTGVGKERTLAGMKALLSQPVRPDSILSLGFAGALRDDLQTGDLVLSRQLHSTEEDAVLVADAGLLGLAQEVLEAPGAPRHIVADSVTVPRMAISVEDKRRLASTTGAWVANMEDYWIRKVASQWEIPFLSVRVVLDTVHQEIPAFVAGLGDMGLLGQVIRVIPNVIARPRNIGHVVTLSKQVKVAQDSLAAFAQPLISRMTAAGSCAIYS